MATFTIDLLTGNLYLFTGDFNGSGSTPTSGSTYPQVNLYTDLPPAGSAAGQIYVVRSGYGTYVLNRKPAGLYFSTGTVWRYLGELPSDLLNSTNFQLLDGVDTSKGIEFVTSGISTGVFRQLKVQDSDGTIAYLTDLNTKLNTSAFADYTGTTAPNTYLSISDFDVYSGVTYTLIQGKQDTLVAGQGINISGTTISVNLPKALQLTDNVGGVNVNNIAATSITWSSVVFSGTSLNYSGGSRIYVQESGTYGISYVLNVNSSSGSDKNIGTLIRKNGNTDITPMSSASFRSNFQNDSSTNVMPENMVTLVNGDYVELVAFRIGYAGQVYTVSNGSWIKMEKKII